MALVIADRVLETSSTIGTGAFTLAGAVTGNQSFSTAIGDGNSTYYTIVNEPNQWEVGIGTYDGTGGTLSRDVVLYSSSGGSPIDFAAGTKNVFVTYPGAKAVYLDNDDRPNANIATTGKAIAMAIVFG